jgi:hypothetical protein
MPRAMLATIVILAIVTGLMPGGPALGGIERPLVVVGSKSPSAQSKKSRKINSYYSRLQQDVLAKLRPVEREEPIDFNAAERVLNSKSSALQKIFDNDFEKKMRDEYSKKVSPFEQTATDPVWRARSWEVQRYEDGRKDLANWTTREVLDDQLKEFVQGGDQSSAPIKVLYTAQELTGGGHEPPSSGDSMTLEQKQARAHRKDLPPLAQAEEEKVPTKLRTKVNLLKANGSLVFSNPVATTSLKGNKDEGFSVGMDREFRKLTLKSNLTYGVKQECLNLNVNKKITDRVSLDLDHATYTGGKTGPSGEKTREQARVNYSMSF